MIWAEPNLEGRFLPMPPDSAVGPRKYADVLDAAYVALKKQSRRNRVIGGMTWTAGVIRPKYFIEDMERSNGRPPRMDFYGHNPFSTRYPDLIDKPAAPATRDFGDIDSLHRNVRSKYKGSYYQYRRDTPRLWLSEYTVQSDRNSRAFSFHVSREQQARWLQRAYEIADDKRLRLHAGLVQPPRRADQRGVRAHNRPDDQRRRAQALLRRLPGGGAGVRLRRRRQVR